MVIFPDLKLSKRVNEPSKARRNFLSGFAGLWAAKAVSGAPAQSSQAGDFHLPECALAQNYQSLKHPSYDRTGGNADRWPLASNETREVFNAQVPGVNSHIWFTIAAPTTYHLQEIVLRIYWDGNAKPSVEVPVGDFFGLNLGHYNVYQSAFLNCSSAEALNSYCALPSVGERTPAIKGS
jgi:Protein of unknown function (DUF2961)